MDGSAQGKPGAFGPIMVLLPLAAFLLVLLWDWPSLAYSGPGAATADRQSAWFPLCDGPVRVTCVVDGDTIWLAGEKIRIADINTPEVSAPACPREARLGREATLRLQELLNHGPFTVEPGASGRDTDSYGRSLRVITRHGESLGTALVAEGLAERWQGYRRNWC